MILVLLAAILQTESQEPVRRVAFGSCAHQDQPQPIWDPIVAAKPDLFVFLGDNVYADTKDMEVMKGKYAKFAAVPGFQRLKKTCPILATWDDHDYGGNDAGREYPKKAESQRIFLDFWEDPPDSPRRKREGVYDAKVYGSEGKRLQVILLDTRYFRSPLRSDSKGYVPDPDPDATFLGEAPWRWFEEQLKAPAEIRIIVSSIQVVAEDHPYEKWANFPKQREKLFRLIRESKAAGVVFISGDRHFAELSMMDGGVGYPIYDLTSSAFNRSAKRWRTYETSRRRVATLNWLDNFGVIEIEWERRDPLIRLQVRDVDGDIAIQQKVFLSMLQFGTIK
ncbi:MAG: alkaline phosphatase family protein [Planctomycetes bacterium]|nr:alkaline phosphatase family protein [Planctomycetota bacterium]